MNAALAALMLTLLARRREPNVCAVPGRIRGRLNREQIRGQLLGQGFRRLWDGTPALDDAGRRALSRRYRGGDTPIGILPAALRAAMGARSSVLRLSRDGISHIRYRHPDVGREDLVIVQSILDGDRVFRQGMGRWIGFARDAEGQLWFGAWRVLPDRDRAYCLTVHRAEGRQAARDERRYGPRIRRER